MFAAQGRSQGA